MKPPYGLDKGRDFSKMPVPKFWQGPHDTWHGVKLARRMKAEGVEVAEFLGKTASTQHQLAFLKKHFAMDQLPDERDKPRNLAKSVTAE